MALTKNQGYTLDQTILVVGIIGVLLTLIIMTIGWRFMNNSQATKAVALLRQIESANSQFYSAHQMWPIRAGEAAYEDDAAAGYASFTASFPGLTRFDAGISILLSDDILSSGTNTENVDMILANYQNLLHGLQRNDDGQAMHTFGVQALVQQLEIDFSSDPMGEFNNGTHYVIRLSNIDVDVALEMDEIIDNEIDYDRGRLFVRGTTPNNLRVNCTGAPATVTSGLVNVCYVANLI